jgi:hypothetical protein
VAEAQFSVENVPMEVVFDFTELMVAAGKMTTAGAGVNLPLPPSIMPWSVAQKAHIPKFFNPATPEYAMCLNGQMHFIGTSDCPGNRGNCALCYRTHPCKQGEKWVQHFCRQCGVWMHLSCFQEWHLMAKPVSPEFCFALGLVNSLSREKLSELSCNQPQ